MALLTARKPHRPIPVHLYRSATTICPAGVEILFHCARQALRSRCRGESPSNAHPVVIVLPQPAAAAVVAAVAHSSSTAAIAAAAVVATVAHSATTASKTAPAAAGIRFVGTGG